MICKIIIDYDLLGNPIYSDPIYKIMDYERWTRTVFVKNTINDIVTISTDYHLLDRYDNSISRDKLDHIAKHRLHTTSILKNIIIFMTQLMRLNISVIYIKMIIFH
jgi:hypothetical protein